MKDKLIKAMQAFHPGWILIEKEYSLEFRAKSDVENQFGYSYSTSVRDSISCHIGLLEFIIKDETARFFKEMKLLPRKHREKGGVTKARGGK